MNRSDKWTAFIDRQSKALGFDAIGIVSAKERSQLDARLNTFLEQGFHGTMSWMEETRDRRANPKAIWPDVESIIMLGMNYGPETDPLVALEQTDKGTISVYARHRDYHDVIKGRLKTLASKIVARSKSASGHPADVKVFVDTAPVMEKPHAQSAGLGWQGKHTNLVSREFGSWLFLGAIFTNLKLPVSKDEIDHCGSCRSCLDVCPTNAFPAPYQLDARRCISYLTIEHHGPIPEEFRRAMGNRIYGCDDCLAVCPWNKFAQQASEAKLAQPAIAQSNALGDFLKLDDAAFRQRFSGSPVKRIGRNRFIRNCLIAAGNSGDGELIEPAMAHLEDEDAVVQEAARWALKELS